jgi:hypothetical protein
MAADQNEIELDGEDGGAGGPGAPGSAGVGGGGRPREAVAVRGGGCGDDNEIALDEA